MQRSREWGDGVMLAAATRLYNRKILVVLAAENVTVSLPLRTDVNAHNSTIYVGYVSSMKHYVYLEPKDCETPRQQSSPNSCTGNATGTGLVFMEAHSICYSFLALARSALKQHV